MKTYKQYDKVIRVFVRDKVVEVLELHEVSERLNRQEKLINELEAEKLVSRG
jgi:hypothetical protein